MNMHNAGHERDLGLFYDTRLLLLLFVSFRFMLFIAFEPTLTSIGETGIGAGRRSALSLQLGSTFG